MARMTLELPEQFPFSTDIAVRISDINYAGHLGNDAIVSLIHEARLRFLKAHNFTELDIEGFGLIMTDLLSLSIALSAKRRVKRWRGHGQGYCSSIMRRDGLPVFQRGSRQPLCLT